MLLTSNQNGAVTEAAIAKAAAELEMVSIVLWWTSVATSSSTSVRACCEFSARPLYASELDRCFLFPIAWIDGRSTLQLRLGPTRNNQTHRINWAGEFDFAATLSRLQGP